MNALLDKVLQRYRFPFPPFDYQRSQVAAHLEGCADHAGYYWKMGAGKTYGTTLHALAYREMTGAQNLRIVPPILLRQWSRWLTSCGISHKVYAGAPKERKEVKFDNDTCTFLMSVEILKKDFNHVFESLHRRKLDIDVDEATSIKNHESGNFRAILQMQYGQSIRLLTGTPLSTPADAYAYVKLISPHIYRSFKQFENLHVESSDIFGRPTAWRGLESIKAALANRSSFIDTREVHPDLPASTISELEYDLAPHHKKLYKTLVDQQLLIYESGAVLDATTPNKLHHALQQVIINYGYFAQDHSLVPAGFDALDETLAELGNQKLVVFANYKRTVSSTVAYLRLQGLDVVQVNGDVTQAQKDAAIERFINEPQCRVAVLNPEAGGVGVDGLQKVCNNMLFLELPTVSKAFWQAVTRLERPGQKFVTNVGIATALGTVQVHLRKQLLQNDALIQQVVPSLNNLRAQMLGG